MGGALRRQGVCQAPGRGELEAAWDAAVGEEVGRQTRLGGVRHGVLSVTVAHSALLEELSAFRKADLLAALRRDAPGTLVHDLRFRVGPVDRPAISEGVEGTPNTPAAPKKRGPRKRPCAS